MISIREYRAEDSVSEITALLHLSYRRLADLGLRYNATWQGDDITRERLCKGTAYLAFDGAALVGTIALEDQRATGGCAWYDRGDVASFHQFAVHPAAQGRGIGRLLLAAAEAGARAAGARELALDTAERAYHLIDLYLSLGFRIVGEADWDSTNYLSVIMSKDLAGDGAPPPRHEREFLRDQPDAALRAEAGRLEAEIAAAGGGGDAEAARARLLGRLGDAYRTLREPAKALACLERATAACVRLGDERGVAANRLRTAIAYHYAGKHAVADLVFAQLVRDLPEDSEHLDFVHQHHGKCLAEQGRRDEARAALLKARALRLGRAGRAAQLASTEAALAAL